MSWFTRKPLPFIDTGVRRSYLETLQGVHALTGTYPALRDSVYTTISSKWFYARSTQDAMRKHFWDLPDYTSEAFDCENYASALVQFVCIEAAKSRVKASPLVFVHCVKNLIPWAGVSDGNHAINLIELDEDFVVIEPQSIKRNMFDVPFIDYPNKSYEIYS